MHEFVLTLHIFGAGAMIGSALMAVVILRQNTVSRESLRILVLCSYVLTLGAFWQLFTGLHLFQTEYEALARNPYFWAKMALFVVGGAIAGSVVERQTKKLLARNPHLDRFAPAKLQRILFLSVAALAVILALSGLGVVLSALGHSD